MPIHIDGETFKDFDSAVNHVKKKGIKDPEAYVATIERKQRGAKIKTRILKTRIAVIGKTKSAKEFSVSHGEDLNEGDELTVRKMPSGASFFMKGEKKYMKARPYRDHLKDGATVKVTAKHTPGKTLARVAIVRFDPKDTDTPKLRQDKVIDYLSKSKKPKSPTGEYGETNDLMHFIDTGKKPGIGTPGIRAIDRKRFALEKAPKSLLDRAKKINDYYKNIPYSRVEPEEEDAIREHEEHGTKIRPGPPIALHSELQRKYAQQLKQIKINLQEQRLALKHDHKIHFRFAKQYKAAELVKDGSEKYWKYWLLNAKQTNGNGWGVSPESIETNITRFIDRPFVITAKQWISETPYDSYEHPYLPTNNLDTIFAHQERFRVGNINKVFKDDNDDWYAMIKPLSQFAHRTPPPFCSPAIFQLDPMEMENNLTQWEALHLAGLDIDPAYGALIASLKGTCIGTEEQCFIQFRGAKQQHAIFEKTPYERIQERSKRLSGAYFTNSGLKNKQILPQEADKNRQYVDTGTKIRPPKPTQLDRTKIIKAKLEDLQHIAASNDVITAFRNKQSGRSGNYSTDGKSFFLFKNEIARHSDKGLQVTNAGYDTATTYTALRRLGVDVSFKNNKPQFHGKPYTHGKFVTIPYDKLKTYEPKTTPKKTPSIGLKSTEGALRLRMWATHIRARAKGLSEVATQPQDQKTINSITGIKTPVPPPVKATASHHIFYKSKVPGLAYNLNNGIAVDRISHREIHRLNAKQKLAAYKIGAPAQVKINPAHGRVIADAYDQMKHEPNHPAVRASYGALINETSKQFSDLMKNGLKIERIKGDNPYPNSKAMHEDIEKNNHLYYYPTAKGFGQGESNKDHPMLQPTDFKDDNQPLLANDVFRIVHDVNGHHLGGKTGFGPTGEHQAYLQHRKMYSPLARKALFTETAGQNNWVNFSKSHGEKNRADPKNTTYAEQKAGLLPDYIVNGDFHV